MNDWCPDCFRRTWKNGVCSSCGFQEGKEGKNLLRLALFCKLNGRYLVGRVLGSGGFGITYKAYDLASQEVCALKEFVPRGLVNRFDGQSQLYVTSRENESDFEHGKERFMEEARILKKLEGIPEVVTVKDYFEENNTVYFVMDYIRGVNLIQLMKVYGGAIPAKEASEIICRVGNCLEQAHTRGHIFHRDISPDNIMITQDGGIKLIDFGNAKYLVSSQNKTMSPVLKHGYAPPEQYSSSGNQGSFTDVYALAATFYHIVTGTRLKPSPDRWGDDNYVPLEEQIPEIPKKCSDAVSRALILNSRQRTQGMGEFVRGMQWDGGTDSGGGSGQAGTGTSRGMNVIPYVRLAAQGKEIKWNLAPNRITRIGRSGKCADIVPGKDERMSKAHCEIYYDSILECFCLVDISTNGTFLKGHKLEKGKIYGLKAGERFAIGKDIYVMEVGIET